MFTFENLDEVTRKYMIEEIELAEKSGNIYFSTVFNINNDPKWIELLKEAAKSYNEHWLTEQLEENNMFKEYMISKTRTGQQIQKRVSEDSAQKLAEGQFNRFYIIALCRRAIDDGKLCVTVYRARKSEDTRSESNALIDSEVNAKEVLTELRNVDTSLKSNLIRPNSGLSVRI